MTIIAAEFMVGETIQLGLEATAGDPTSLTGVEAKGRALRFGIPVGDTVIDFTVTPRAAAGGIGAGFNLTAPAPDQPGSYGVNLKGTVGGVVFKSDTVIIRIVPSPT